MNEENIQQIRKLVTEIQFVATRKNRGATQRKYLIRDLNKIMQLCSDIHDELPVAWR